MQIKFPRPESFQKLTYVTFIQSCIETVLSALLGILLRHGYIGAYSSIARKHHKDRDSISSNKVETMMFQWLTRILFWRTRVS